MALDVNAAKLCIWKYIADFLSIYVCGVYRSPAAGDGIYNCLFASMSAVKDFDARGCFAPVGDSQYSYYGVAPQLTRFTYPDLI